MILSSLILTQYDLDDLMIFVIELLYIPVSKIMLLMVFPEVLQLVVVSALYQCKSCSLI